MDRNSLTYAGFPHTYAPPKMTENHGVPGSNPGPATSKSPANGGKIYSFDGAVGALFLRRVNSRLKKGPFKRGSGGELHAFCGADVGGDGHPVMGVSWTGEARVARWQPSLEPTSTTVRHAACLGSSTRRPEASPTGQSSTRRPSALASRSAGSPART